MHGQAAGQGSRGADHAFALPQGFDVVGATFNRSGTDLVVVGRDGTTFVVEGFFVGAGKPVLLAADGSPLVGDAAQEVAAIGNGAAPGTSPQPDGGGSGPSADGAIPAGDIVADIADIAPASGDAGPFQPL